ncbi:MAG: hypothetical protein F6J87_25980 [Spirulina sp. SIO3F2]|nr:hypothetical protein [Spirulina sp. SIO3F2]
MDVVGLRASPIRGQTKRTGAECIELTRGRETQPLPLHQTIHSFPLVKGFVE